jgi:hypothetical protein
MPAGMGMGIGIGMGMDMGTRAHLGGGWSERGGKSDRIGASWKPIAAPSQGPGSWRQPSAYLPYTIRLTDSTRAGDRLGE